MTSTDTGKHAGPRSGYSVQAGILRPGLNIASTGPRTEGSLEGHATPIRGIVEKYGLAGVRGLLYGDFSQFLAQVLDCAVVVFSFAMAWVWFKLSDRITPLRVKPEAELDIPEVGAPDLPRPYAAKRPHLARRSGRLGRRIRERSGAFRRSRSAASLPGPRRRLQRPDRLPR